MNRFAGIATVALVMAALAVSPCFSETSSLSHSYVGKKAVALPFRHVRSTLGNFERVNNRLDTFLHNQGLLVHNRDKVKKAFWRMSIDPRSSDLSPNQLRYLAQQFDTDLLITGEIIDFRHQKKFRLPNLLIFPPGLGYVLYGTVSLSTRVYDAHTGKMLYQHAVEHRGKNQFGGFYQHPGSVMDRVLNNAVLDLFRNFFHPTVETYRPAK